MSELSHLVRVFKGDKPTSAILKGADVSRETFRKIDHGQSVKLATLRSISKYLRLSQDQWRQIVMAWVKLEIGSDARHIQLVQTADALHGRADKSHQIQNVAAQLEPSDQKQVLLAMSRPEVRRLLHALNDFYEACRNRKRDVS